MPHVSSTVLGYVPTTRLVLTDYTVRANEFKAGAKSSSAASCLSWACKWIVVFELWLNGDIPFEEFDTNKHIF